MHALTMNSRWYQAQRTSANKKANGFNQLGNWNASSKSYVNQFLQRNIFFLFKWKHICILMVHFPKAFQSISMGRLFSLMSYSAQIIFKMVLRDCFQCKCRGPFSVTLQFPELAFLGKKTPLVWHFLYENEYNIQSTKSKSKLEIYRLTSVLK